MKIPITKLDEYVKTLPRGALERLARNVVCDLYGVAGKTDLYEWEGNDGHVDSEKEWDSGADVCDAVNSSLGSSYLAPEDIQKWLEDHEEVKP